MFGNRRLLLLLVSFMIVGASISVVYAPANPPPNISNPLIKPSSPGPYDAVTVNVNVTSARSTIKNVTITYTTDNWMKVNTTILATYSSATGAATAQIPPLTQGGTVAYYITSYDSSGGKSVNNNNGSNFSYLVPTPPSPVNTLTFVIVMGIIAVAISVVVFMILKPPMGSTKEATPSSYRE